MPAVFPHQVVERLAHEGLQADPLFEGQQVKGAADLRTEVGALTAFLPARAPTEAGLAAGASWATRLRAARSSRKESNRLIL